MYAILRDAAIRPVPECTAPDLERWLRDAGAPVIFTDLEGLGALDSATVEVLLVPYLTGEFGAGFDALLAFHARGGALLFLGDVPHHGCWYPLRNSRAADLHLTRCNDDLRIRGFSAQARSLLGELPSPDPVLNKSISALRVSAYPPDVAHNLLEAQPGSDWPARAVVLVERKGDSFFGARLGIIGFTGGEPRENAAGIFPREWTYDPGLLTREWSGLPLLVARMAGWLGTRQVEGALRCRPVIRAGEADLLTVRVKNAGAARARGRLFLMRDEAPVWSSPEIQLAPAEIYEHAVSLESRFGIETWTLGWADAATPDDAGPRRLHLLRRRILPATISAASGMGFSTYQSFRNGVVTNAFRQFVHELRRSGMQYMRCNIPWEDVEPQPGIYDWGVPDQLVALAKESGLALQFWCFPTTRGSGLSDAGVPAWALREAAVDRTGKKGFFPSLGSPYYNTHYFAMLDAFVCRYAKNPALTRFVLDYGNSDFPYGYFYYGSDPNLFDYTEWERKAFSSYLLSELHLEPAALCALYEKPDMPMNAIPVPTPEQADAWRLYLDYRAFAIGKGVHRAAELVAQRAPDKVPPDYPGHGLGAISDLSTYLYEAKARHWSEEATAPASLTRLHNAGPTWGGEAWQVGGSFSQMDASLFNSLRLNASYFTVAGPDLGVAADDVARLAHIRLALQGATRPEPRIAILDSLVWCDHASLCHIGARLDQPVVLLGSQTRFDFQCFSLLVMPPKNVPMTTTGSGRAGGHLVPTDLDWYQRLFQAVVKGSRILVFPETFAGLSQAWRQEMGGVFPELFAPSFHNPTRREIACPASFGGGKLQGRFFTVEAVGTVLLKDAQGRACLVERPFGKGSILAAGWGAGEEGPDAVPDPGLTKSCREHTLARLLGLLGLHSERIASGQAFLYKELLDIRDGKALLLFSEWKETRLIELEVRLEKPAKQALDLSTGERYPVAPGKRNGWFHLSVPVRFREGRYFVFE